jgi:hypothetical protein
VPTASVRVATGRFKLNTTMYKPSRLYLDATEAPILLVYHEIITPVIAKWNEYPLAEPNKGGQYHSLCNIANVLSVHHPRLP